MCNANGAWTGHTPQCKPIACGDPQTFPHASVALLNGNNVTWIKKLFGGKFEYHSLKGRRCGGRWRSTPASTATPTPPRGDPTRPPSLSVSESALQSREALKLIVMNVPQFVSMCCNMIRYAPICSNMPQAQHFESS